jgi:hypothetical protein
MRISMIVLAAALALAPVPAMADCNRNPGGEMGEIRAWTERHHYPDAKDFTREMGISYDDLFALIGALKTTHHYCVDEVLDAVAAKPQVFRDLLAKLNTEDPQ